MPRVHLHADDCPQALAVLAAVVGSRQALPGGYEPTEHGAWVDWDELAASWLSSTERAAVVVARGVAAAERQGGWPPRLRWVMADAIEFDKPGGRAQAPLPAADDRAAFVAVVERADALAPLWADDHRQVAEVRLGVTAGDLAVLDDPAYGLVLDAVAAVRAALVKVREAEGEGSGSAGGVS